MEGTLKTSPKKESLLLSAMPRVLESTQQEERPYFLPHLLYCPPGTRQQVESSASLVRLLREQKASLPQSRCQPERGGAVQGGKDGGWEAGR